ncbi:hypothetical protein F0562_032172 [Nyssa sinensis]|uniref:Uncharacterized protein n=1 Tax=Nyssa sinensis TaxID=561372 RepID=A0A5J5AU46_9ASTE|nr:hypothetical protein F0562_032172 [Nyssa sinensis]
MEAQGFAESSPSSILNASISNVHGRHDLSALLLESQLEEISGGVDGDANEDALIHETYLGHSWADRAEEGEFIPQVALDLESDFGGFLKDPSFLMESFQGDASSPSLRGSSNLKNGSHGGRGGGGRGARVVRGIKTNKPSIRPALCGKEGLSFQDQHRECPLGSRENQGGNNNQYPLGNLGNFERAGGPSQNNQKADGIAPFSSDMGSHRGVAIGDQLVGKVIHQGTKVQAVQGFVSAQKGAFLELICSTKKLSYSDVRGGNTLGVKGVQPMGNTLAQGDEVRAVQGSLTTQKVTPPNLMCGNKGLSFQAKNGEHPLGNPCIHGREDGPPIGMQKAESAATFCPAMGGISGGAKEE